MSKPESADIPKRFEHEGFVHLPDIADAGSCGGIARQLEAFDLEGAGSRGILDQSWCIRLAWLVRAHPRIRSLVPTDAVAVQCTLFDKSPEKNWLVALHQDLSIPVKSRVDSTECSGWSEKERQLYVQPPVAVLEQLVAVRIHIDDCPEESGALPRSHWEGRLSRERAEALRLELGETVVPVGRGGVLVMRPLILHASSKGTSVTSRRVLHFVYGPPLLPLGLEWRWAVPLQNQGPL